MPEPGVFFAVVGPSGAGKDTLLRFAQDELKNHESFVFVRRAITRPAHAESEDHIPVTPEEFAAQREQSAFVLSWEAHGLSYGIPASTQAIIASGKHAIANLSRAAIADAMSAFENVCVIHVIVSAEALAGRLAGRGREDADGVQRRLNRRSTPLPKDCEVVEIDNSGTSEEAGKRFLQVLINRTAESA